MIGRKQSFIRKDARAKAQFLRTKKSNSIGTMSFLKTCVRKSYKTSLSSILIPGIRSERGLKGLCLVPGVVIFG